MKKHLVTLLAVVLIASLFVPACAEKRGIPIMGRLINTMVEEESWRTYEAIVTKDNPFDESQLAVVNYDGLTQMLMDLQAGRIDYFMAPASTARYILTRNPDLTMVAQPKVRCEYRMAVMPENAALMDVLNAGLKRLMADGTVGIVVDDYITHPERDEKASAAAFFIEPSIVVGVTGDKPPMDYTSADGLATGFNVTLLSMICAEADYGFESLSITTGAREAALASGVIDVCFWMEVAPLESERFMNANVLLSEVYYGDDLAFVTKDFPLERIKAIHRIAD